MKNIRSMFQYNEDDACISIYWTLKCLQYNTNNLLSLNIFITFTITIMRFGSMTFNATFNNISVILWPSVLLVEETGVLGENHRPVASRWQNLSHNVVSNTPHHERGSNSQIKWWQALIAQVVLNPTTIRSRPRRPLMC